MLYPHSPQLCQSLWQDFEFDTPVKNKWTTCGALFQELSQEKQRTLELLGVTEQVEQEKTVLANEVQVEQQQEEEEEKEAELLQDLRHIEEQMKLLLTEKEQAEGKWVGEKPASYWENWSGGREEDPWCFGLPLGAMSCGTKTSS